MDLIFPSHISNNYPLMLFLNSTYLLLILYFVEVTFDILRKKMGKLGTSSREELVRLILIFVISLFIIIYMTILTNIGLLAYLNMHWYRVDMIKCLKEERTSFWPLNFNSRVFALLSSYLIELDASTCKLEQQLIPPMNFVICNLFFI